MATRAGRSSAASSSCWPTTGRSSSTSWPSGGRRIAAGVWFEDAEAWYLYNAGVDPEARELSPGVLLSALALQAAIGAGRRRFDYLRGDEPYKYEWGAVDEPIQRLLVVRTGA